MSTLLATVLTAAIIGVLVHRRRAQRRRPTVSSGRTCAGATKRLRVTDPQQSGTTTVVWMLQACSAHCVTARTLGGRRLATEHAPPLPLPGADPRCSCHYRPLTDQRVRERRSGENRRVAYRLDSEGDRRNRDRRRAVAAWGARIAR